MSKAVVVSAAAHPIRFLDTDTADRLFERLCSDVDWRQEHVFLFGARRAVPRLVAWCGEGGLNYRYAGVDHPCHGWLPALTALRARLADELGFHSNLVLLNRYRNGDDAMGWHRDDEPGLEPGVASLSLGATRRFLVRAPDAARSTVHRLEHGSLLLFDARQRHALPRTRRPVGERVNLTFRCLATAAP